MSHLQHRQEKIQNKRKQTSFRDYVKEIASWHPLTVHKTQKHVSIFPDTERTGNITSVSQYHQKFSNIMYDTLPEYGSFFENLSALFRHHTKPATIQFGENENSSFANCVFRAKDTYLSFVVGETCDNVFHSSIVYSQCSHVYDSVSVTNNSQNIYNSKGVSNSFNVFFSVNIHNSSDIRASSNLIGCHHCIRCDSLENQSYCIDNKQYSKEEYQLQKAQIDKYTFLGYVQKKGNNMASVDVTGEGLFACNALENGYYATRLKDGRNVCYIGGVNGCTDFYDVFEAGIDSSNFYAVCNAGTNTHHIYCSSLIDTGSTHIYYSYHLETCSYCLGCIGLRNKSFCIFNKQYTKEERHEKVDEIFAQMDKDGDLGKFFPASMNPFYFNDTAASLMEDYSKEEIVADGYLWRDEVVKVDIPEGVQTVKTSELGKYEGWRPSSQPSPQTPLSGDIPSPQTPLPEGEELPASGNGAGKQRYIDPSILKKVIIDETGNAYRIMKNEYDFLIKYELPLPRKHRLERLKGHFKVK